MTIKELLDLANKGYPDGFLENYYTKEGKKKRGSGDTFAEGIVIELIETFDAEQEDASQVGEALRVIATAWRDIQGVCDELERKLAELEGISIEDFTEGRLTEREEGE